MTKSISFALMAVVFALVSFVNPASTTYKADVKNSKLTWVGKKITGEHTGEITLSSGSLTFEGKNLKGGSFEIDMTSITCTDLTDQGYNQKLVGHLKSDDFFSTDKFPKSSFVISSVTSKGNDQYDIQGKLTIKGITNEISFPATIKTEGNTVKATANIVVDRTKYDIKYGSGSFFDNLGDKAINDEFEIKLELVATK
ncbi:MAG TPA: YceI family protein [Cytophagaceae bacterium]